MRRITGCVIGAVMAASLSATVAQAATLGVSIAHFDENFLTLIINAIRDEAAKTGMQVQFEDARGDTQRQLNQVQNFVAQHADAIIVNAVDSAATSQLTRAANAAGIPLVY